MKQVKVRSVLPPVDPAGPITSQRMYSVSLGNHRVVYFASDRHAKAFQADASRFLNDTLGECNLMLADAFVLYRHAWPYLGGAAAAKAVKDTDAKAAQCVRDAEVALDRVANGWGGGNAVFMSWKYLADALGAIRAMAILLQAFYVAKTMGVQRCQIQVLLKRANMLLDALKHYGADVDTATLSRPSPYGQRD